MPPACSPITTCTGSRKRFHLTICTITCCCATVRPCQSPAAHRRAQRVSLPAPRTLARKAAVNARDHIDELAVDYADPEERETIGLLKKAGSKSATGRSGRTVCDAEVRRRSLANRPLQARYRKRSPRVSLLDYST